MVQRSIISLPFTLNLLTTNVPHHIGISQLICSPNQFTGFYMMGTLFVNGLKRSFFVEKYYFYWLLMNPSQFCVTVEKVFC